MKPRDYIGAGAKAVKAAASAAVSAVVKTVPEPAALSRDARDELRRRAEINARGAAARAEMQAALFGRTRWMGGRGAGWMNRGR